MHTYLRSSYKNPSYKFPAGNKKEIKNVYSNVFI